MHKIRICKSSYLVILCVHVHYCPCCSVLCLSLQYDDQLHDMSLRMLRIWEVPSYKIYLMGRYKGRQGRCGCVTTSKSHIHVHMCVCHCLYRLFQKFVLWVLWNSFLVLSLKCSFCMASSLNLCQNLCLIDPV